MTESDENNLSQNEAGWRLLGIVNFARLLAGAVLLIVFATIGLESGWGSQHPQLFYSAATGLLIASIIFGFAIRSRRFSQESIALLGSIVDSLLFSMIIHSSGGIGQGISIMLLMSLCATSLILPRQTAAFAAAVAFIFLFGQQILADYEAMIHVGDYTSIGIFGIALFLSSWGAQVLGERYRLTEQLALQRGVDIANLSQLNDYVVQRLREGVVVIDGEGTTRLINVSAARMLNIDHPERNVRIQDLSTVLYNRWKNAVSKPLGHDSHALTMDGLSNIVPSFIALGHQQSDGMLMFLEDTSIMQERIQQSKLAALGRLSASIAHEIRNPLAAISHAEQLLSESEDLKNEDRYFTGLINRHVKRVNQIVENVLSLSRASTGKPEEIDLREWIINFVIEYMQLKQLGSNQIRYSFPETQILVPFAKSQLHQIVENILDNAITHSGMSKDELHITLTLEQHSSGRWALLMSDNGQGFKDESIEEIFEPFHSGNPQSSGLGLYISRELATLNRANLSARNSQNNSALFELIFADLGRWIT